MEEATEGIAVVAAVVEYVGPAVGTIGVVITAHVGWLCNNERFHPCQF